MLIATCLFVVTRLRFFVISTNTIYFSLMLPLMMCVTTTDMRPEGFCEVRDCNNINNTNNNNNKNSSSNKNNNCIGDTVDHDSDVVRDPEFNNCKYISTSCKIRNCDGNNNNVICDRPRRNRYIYRLVYIFIMLLISSEVTRSLKIMLHLSLCFY